MTEATKEINELFEKHVPESGSAETVGGEIVRAMCKIGYRWLNDGDQLGIGYGRETVNPAGRYLAAMCDEPTAKAVKDAWECHSEEEYGKRLDELTEKVADCLRKNPQLFETKCLRDMYQFADPVEDVDDYEDDEEDCEDYDDEEE